MNETKEKDFFEKKLLNETIAIDKAMSDGRNSPWNSSSSSAILRFSNGGRLFRRFIESYSLEKRGNLINTQVRDKQVDTKYCKEELAPLLVKDGKICEPIMVSSKSSTVKNIDNGHNRVQSSGIAFGDDALIPTFTISKECYQETSNVGAATTTYESEASPSRSNLYFQELSKIKCNQPNENLQYSYPDVPIQLGKLFECDPTLGGTNPDGSAFPSRKAFDTIMDNLHPRQFHNEGTRSKIYNRWEAGASSIKVNVTFDSITSDLANAEYDSGVVIAPRTGKKARKRFLDWQDPKEKVLLGVTSTNGKTFDRDFFLPLICAHADGELNKAVKIVLHMKIASCPSTMLKLASQRNAAIKRIEESNRRFAKLGVKANFVKVIMPKQLQDAEDKGFTWEKKSGAA
jgi:hypothetical protein